MTENDSETQQWTGKYRLHNLNMAVMSFGFAAVMLGLNLAEAFAAIGAISMVAWFLDVLAEQYIEHKNE